MDDRSLLASALSGRYDIERQIGRGGMATVYLARDVRHTRQVALKVLDPDLGAVLGGERFLSEIRVTANLQHPNLLPLFDSGEADGLLFYVMPFVEGETLRARLERERQLPIDEAVRIATGIAAALDYAHRHGVIHRDLKPENVLLHDGQPLVADFGIALAVSNAGGQRVTQTGLSLGTPQYMSPEQATGDRAIDARTDIYSLGALTYEMLAGEPPHTGSTAQAVIARLMTEEPRPLSSARKTVPPQVEAAVARALQKLPADRFETAKQFAEALTNPATAAATTFSRGGASSKHALRGMVAVSLALAIVAAMSMAAWWRASHVPSAERPVVRVALDFPPGDRALTGYPLIVSPAGDRVAYVVEGTSGFRTFVRKTSELTGRQIAATSLQNLTFSPDGRWVAYTDGSEIRKISSDSGAPIAIGGFPREVADRFSNRLAGLAWGSANTIAIGSDAGLWVIPASGGVARRLEGMDSTGQNVSPVMLPDGNTVVYGRNVTGSVPLGVAKIDGRRMDRLTVSGLRPLAFIQGYLIYQSPSFDLFAVAFDMRAGRTAGDPVQVEAGIGDGGLSASGTLAYVPSKAVNDAVLVGGGPGETALMKESRRYSTPRYSPDGRRVAFAVGDGSASDIWIYTIATNTFSRLTTEAVNTYPEWSPDGTRILFMRAGDGIRHIAWQAADGSSPARPLLKLNETINEAVLSPDAKWIVYRTAPNAQHPRDIFALHLTGDSPTGDPVPIAVGPASEEMPRISPDSRWIAYQSDESGRNEIYVRPFPGPGPRIPISDNGGVQPVWSRSGRALSYRTTGSIISVAVTTGPMFTVGGRTTVATGAYLDNPSHANFDISPDGTRYLVLKQAGGESQAVIVHNWDRELREKLGIKR